MSSLIPKIILASTSPRRAEILKLLQIPFEVKAPLYEEESLADLSPYEEAKHFAIEKARSLVKLYPEALIIGSDTLLEFEGEKIGKPQNAMHAQEILLKLASKSHDVLSGVCLLDTRSMKMEASVEVTRIEMRNYCKSEVETYIQQDKPFDKAGAYALQGQGRFLIQTLKGDYLSAVGLPLRFIANTLQAWGYTQPKSVGKIYSEKNFMNWKSYGA